ncbi:RsmB/NOP family class I SAM-dependent RNA methyltransferase [Candidatus Uhrbacteria bacterium]|nr:RsmB/NOP family class I SAM-dependent RNA methyltransferase [Candidatus Uhrbacteria bacterium]
MQRRLPLLFLDRLAAQYGPSARDRIVAAFGVDRRPTFRANTLKIADQELMSRLREQGIAFERIKAIPHAFICKSMDDKELLETDVCTAGFIYLQGLSSMVPPIVLDPKPGERVLDLCAAPGSKTSQMAAMMGNEGFIVAMESDAVRFQKLTHTIAKQGVTIEEAKEGDASLLCRGLESAFDKVLADVPCSAEGRISTKDPRSFRFWSQKNIIAHAKEQRRLLRAAVASLKVGGTLVYSTCTLAPEENELMVDWLAKEYPSVVQEQVTVNIDGRKAKEGYLTLLPTDAHEGLFVAKFRKKQVEQNVKTNPGG